MFHLDISVIYRPPFAIDPPTAHNPERRWRLAGVDVSEIVVRIEFRLARAAAVRQDAQIDALESLAALALAVHASGNLHKTSQNKGGVRTAFPPEFLD